jgi:hypothetical protein
MTTRTEKARIKQYVLDHYADRNPRNVRVMSNGAVYARVQTEARRLDDEQIFCGWDTEIIQEIDMIKSIETEDERCRMIDELNLLCDRINRRFELGPCGLVITEHKDGKFRIADDQWLSKPVPYSVALASLRDAAYALDLDDVYVALCD